MATEIITKIATRENFQEAYTELFRERVLACDTETTGLRPYHGDYPFSVALSAGPSKTWYFNFFPYAELPKGALLGAAELDGLKSLLGSTDVLWFFHNAKFDLHMLARVGIEVPGKIHCTQAIGRVVYNNHLDYSLSSSLERIGEKKDDLVDAWIRKNKAYETVKIPGRAKGDLRKHYERAPFDLISAYAGRDACGTYLLGLHQINEIKAASDQDRAIAVPEMSAVLHNERRLTATLFRMERTGVLIDRRFASDAAQFESLNLERAKSAYRETTGLEYKASWQAFAKVFESEKEKWEYNEPTKTGQVNPSFSGDVLKKFSHPAAPLVIQAMDAKAKENFYTGFLYHMDGSDRVHPHFNSDGGRHGRSSSSDPNFQNLKADEDAELSAEFVVRRAIIPSPGTTLVSIDYDTMEYRFALDLAATLLERDTPLLLRVKAGEDYHQATADLARETSGKEIGRKQAKMANFLTLYGGGDEKLAEGLGIPLPEARSIRLAIKSAAPEISHLIRMVTRTAETRGWIANWFGRRSYFPDSQWAYRAPNYLISGGCADVAKIAMNECDEFLRTGEGFTLSGKSRMILMVHDELVFEVDKRELDIIPKLKQIMESVYPYKRLPLLCSVSTSEKSLADLEEWSG